MKVKTSELEGVALDLLVAKCWYRDRKVEITEGKTGVRVLRDPTYDGSEHHHWFIFRGSTDWAQGCPILVREKICVDYMLNGDCLAVSRLTEKQGWAHDTLVAGLRCYLASELGDEVDVPNELSFVARNTSEVNTDEAIYSKLRQLFESNTEESPTRLALIGLQKSVLLSAMKKHGIQQLKVTYDGYGGSGDISDVSAWSRVAGLPNSNSERAFDMFANSDTIIQQADLSKIDIDAYPNILKKYDQESKQWVSTPEVKTISLVRAVENLTWKAIAVSGHSGWAIEEGGGGTLTLDASKETVNLEHYDNIVEQDYSYHEL